MKLIDLASDRPAVVTGQQAGLFGGPLYTLYLRYMSRVDERRMTVPGLVVGHKYELVELVGEDGVITDPSRLLVYESDALTVYRYPPRAIVFPATTRTAPLSFVGRWQFMIFSIGLLLVVLIVYFALLGLLGELAVKASGMHRRGVLDRILNELH